MARAAPHRLNQSASEAAVPAALAGLLREKKELPTWLLYDGTGCELYERITTLPEYYLTRAETEVLARCSHELVRRVAEGASALSFAELGAGTAKKTQLLLAAAIEQGMQVTYLAADIAPEPIHEARERLHASYPELDVRLVVGTHEDAGPAIARLEGRQVAIFLGSSIGNSSDAQAIELLGRLRGTLRDDACLLLGTDLKKQPEVLERAYDDAEGVTAAFTKNVLTRLNREYGCNFVLSSFRHVAEWNEQRSDIEISLEATRDLRVSLGAIDRDLSLRKGERIVLEICAKYDQARVERILTAAGFTRLGSFLDRAERYALQVARVRPLGALPRV